MGLRKGRFPVLPNWSIKGRRPRKDVDDQGRTSSCLDICMSVCIGTYVLSNTAGAGRGGLCVREIDNTHVGDDAWEVNEYLRGDYDGPWAKK